MYGVQVGTQGSLQILMSVGGSLTDWRGHTPPHQPPHHIHDYLFCVVFIILVSVFENTQQLKYSPDLK